MLGNYKLLKNIGSAKHVLFKVLIILFLIALGYWMLTGFIFTGRLLVKSPIF
jgi:hypothetical protein